MQSSANSCESSNSAAIRKASLGALLSLSQPDVYFCSHCPRGFPSSQSLGGHQNAHRKERNAERKQIMEDSKLVTDKMKNTMMVNTADDDHHHQMPIISPQPLRVVRPPRFGLTDDDDYIIPPHASIRHDQLSSNNHGDDDNLLSGISSFLAFHGLVGSSNFVPPPRPPPPPPLLDMVPHDQIDLNNEYHGNDDEIPFGIPIENPNPDRCLYQKFMPWELDFYPDSELDHLQLRVEVGPRMMDATAAATTNNEGFAMRKKKKTSNGVTFERELDLTLKL